MSGTDAVDVAEAGDRRSRVSGPIRLRQRAECIVGERFRLQPRLALSSKTTAGQERATVQVRRFYLGLTGASA